MAAAVLPPLEEIGFDARKRFTCVEFQRMLDSGIFADQRFELIDGELIDKMGQNPPHAGTIQLVLEWLISLFGPALVRGQLPLNAAVQDQERNVPEPDIAVLVEKKPDFIRRHPRGNELLLVVEVAETSLLRDLTTKRDLYARAEVPEYWVIDLNCRSIIVHRSPAAGAYTHVSTLAENETIELEGHSIHIAKLLP